MTAQTPQVEQSSAHFLILRIALASAVVLSHFPLISATQRSISLMSPTVAVQAFFVISGWVVSASFARSATLRGFWLRRVARLYPLYVFVIISQAIAAWALVRPASGVLRELARYLSVNLAFLNFLQPSVFGLLADAPVKAFNPSLWTLKLEVIFYLLTPLIVMLVMTMARSRRLLGTLALFVAALGLYYLSWWHSDSLARQFPGQFRFFAAGLLCWQLSEHVHIKQRGRLALAAALAFYVANHIVDIPVLGALQPLAISIFVYGAAFTLPEPKRLPDVSYGIYVWHGPLIQFGLLLGVPANLWLACAATLIAATLSWYCIEKPAIHWGRKLTSAVEKRRAVRVPIS